jgi:hypothetical protein
MTTFNTDLITVGNINLTKEQQGKINNAKIDKLIRVHRAAVNKKSRTFQALSKDLNGVFKHQNNRHRTQIISQGSLQQGSKTMKMCTGTHKTAIANSRQSQNDVVKLNSGFVAQIIILLLARLARAHFQGL